MKRFSDEERLTNALAQIPESTKRFGDDELPASTLAPVSAPITQTVGDILAASLERRHAVAISTGRPRFTANEKALLYTVVTRTLGLDKEQLFELETEAGGYPYQTYEELRKGYAAETQTAGIADDLALLDMQRDHADRAIREGYDADFAESGQPASLYDAQTRDELATIGGQVLRLASTNMFIRQEILS